EVRMDPDLQGSWEGSPPSLLDLAVRDRRWAQGNLQHAKVVGACGLRLASRVHFLIGIGAYLMSTVWLAMLAVGALLTAQALIIQPQYFPNAVQLFPDWPVFDAERMRWLFGFSMALLLLPKLAGMLSALASTRLRRRLGGAWRILGGTLLEILLSALFAPILMVMQVRQVWEILSGRDSGWSVQSREGAVMPWREAFRRHWRHVLLGIVPAAAVGWLAPDLVVWLSPVLVGLALAPLLSRLSGDGRVGLGLRRLGLLCTPEEFSEPPVALRAASVRPEIDAACRVSLMDLSQNPALLACHCAALEPDAPVDETVFLAGITARAKIDAAEDARQAVDWMTTPEIVALVGSPELLARWTGRGRIGRTASG
ncbi:MAG TPA: glucans biosynthesis glucosyltransferase MdoH, partial [Paracoccaceae bacterium]|nr:glucans biosynthesis glucosyltransferase MdoH [Paracoccaceae bacterium]